MLPDFSIRLDHLPDLHVVALHGELDVASADGLANSLIDLAGSTLVVGGTAAPLCGARPYPEDSTGAGRESAPRRGPIHFATACCYAEGLPPIETVASCTLTPTNCESNDPQDEKDSCQNPQQMHRESGSKKNQDEQQRKDQ